MVAQQGISYAVRLIAAHFGDSTAKVCEYLIRYGSVSFKELVRFTELPKGKVKNCLLLLIQHNCVQAFSVPETVGRGGVTKPNTLYMAIFDNIIHRMRFPKFYLIVKEHLGNQHAELLEGLLQHGRLTFELLFDRASGLSGGKLKIDDVLSKFNQLVRAHYVERCPKGQPFLEPKIDDNVPSVRKRIRTAGESMTIEQEAIIAAAPLDGDRFSGIVDLMKDTEADLKHTNNGSSLAVSTGSKRKHEVLEAEEDIQNTINKVEVLWRANYEKFMLSLKKKTCVTNVSSRLDVDAAVVLEAMIESSDHQNARTLISATSSMNSIIETVRGKPGGVSMTLERVRAILEQLGCQLCTKETGAVYTIALKDIIEICQNNEVERLISEKYGKEAHRIFRLLIKMGRLVHMDEIAEKTFLEKKDAQKILCKLWKDGYVDMENLYVVGKHEVILWKVKKKELWEHVLNDKFHTAINISLKIAEYFAEYQASHAIDLQKAEQLKRARFILEHSLLKQDDTIMLFHDV